MLKRSRVRLFTALVLVLSAESVWTQTWVNPNPGPAVDCRSNDKDGNELVCTFGGGLTGQSAMFTANSSRIRMSFRYDEYHPANCGPAKGNRIHSETFVMKEIGNLAIRLLDPGSGINCRYVYIVDCKVQSPTGTWTTIPCKDALTPSGTTFKGNKQ